MGDNLILFAVEMGGTKQQPRWARGVEWIETASAGELYPVLDYLSEIGEGEDDLECIRARLLNGLDQLKDAWTRQHRYGCLLYGRKNRMLVVGGTGGGDDPFDGFSDVELLGMLPALLQEVGFR